jgi:ABC-2 type transport system permease protein
MSGATTIARRELGSYFYSPIAYVVMFLFLLICGALFFNDFVPGQPAVMRTLFDWMVWLLVVAVPVLCMGLLAQERSTNTIETLMTAPIDEYEVVLGKFLGSLGLLVILLVPTFLYVLMMRIYARPDIGPILSGYLGIILVGALFISIGLFCSAMTRSQIVAAVTSAAILTIITIIPWWLGAKASLPPFWRTVVDQTVFRRYTDFSKGMVDVGNVVFFIAATVVFLFITTKRLEFERWK